MPERARIDIAKNTKHGQRQSLKDVVWSQPEVAQLACKLASLAANELTRTGGPVRDPDVLRRAKVLVRRRIDSANLAEVVSEVMEASVHLNHPRFVAQQVAAPIPLAALVETVVAALNQSLAVWEMSPGGTPIDRDLINRFKQVFGYPASAEGTMTPGGAFGNLTALLVARGALEPRAWKKGGSGIAFVTGEQTHYSVSRAVGILGSGTDSVFAVPTDRLHRTDASRVPDAFRAARRAGYRKLVLVGTAGSTPTGSFDDLKALAALARREGAWFHVDAAHGGGVIFSHRLRRLLAGIAEADSIVFDPHKMLFMPLTSSTILVRAGDHLCNALEQDAPYLFNGPGRDFPDIGSMTLACSQRFDALKVWLTWKAFSAELWGDLTTSVCAVARAAWDYCARSEILEPVHEPQCNILCFRLRTRPRSVLASDRLHLRIKEAVNASGYAYISSTTLCGQRVLRLVIMNPRTTAEHVLEILRKVEESGQGQLSRMFKAPRE